MKGETEEQFIYMNRKRALGKFKNEINNIDNKDDIILRLEQKFEFFFRKLRVSNMKSVF